MKQLGLFLLLFNPLIAQDMPVNENPALFTKLAMLAGLSLLPFLIMLLTSFLKIVVCLSLLRNALGTPNSPPNQILNGIAIIISIYVMFPTGLAMYKAAEGAIEKAPRSAIISNQSAVFVIDVVDKAKEPLRGFLERNTYTNHQNQIFALATNVLPKPFKTLLKKRDFLVLIPAYITSQLQSAFHIGVLLYLPFFIIDLVVSNILLAMGMMMLSPMSVALPIKILLLVMVDGWTLLIQGVALTFR